MSLLPRTAQLLRIVTGTLCLLPLVQACGGRSDTEDYLFGTEDSGGSSAGGTRGQVGTAARPGNNNQGGSTSTGATGVGGTAPGTGGTRIIGAGGVAGAAQGGAAQGGAGVAGAAGSNAGPTVSCGNATCDSGEQVCCAGLAGFGCIAKGNACNGAVLACTASGDCAGNRVCCLNVLDDTGSSSVCKASCAGMGLGRERQLCRSDDECATGHCQDTVFGVSVCTRR